MYTNFITIGNIDIMFTYSLQDNFGGGAVPPAQDTIHNPWYTFTRSIYEMNIIDLGTDYIYFTL